jgi:predicted RNA-binding Zn-ribbon protein involved in translation (DUF1610 family)
MSRMSKFGKKDGMDDLIALARQLEQVKRQARALGIFTNDRELLECPSCGLLEDVTSEGRLVTYPRSSRDMRDGGQRFIQLDDTSFQCPSCGANVTAVIL